MQEDFDDSRGHEEKFLMLMNKAFEIVESRSFDPLPQIERMKISFTIEKFITSWFKLAARPM